MWYLYVYILIIRKNPVAKRVKELFSVCLCILLFTEGVSLPARYPEGNSAPLQPLPVSFDLRLKETGSSVVTTVPRTCRLKPQKELTMMMRKMTGGWWWGRTVIIGFRCECDDLEMQVGVPLWDTLKQRINLSHRARMCFSTVQAFGTGL